MDKIPVLRIAIIIMFLGFSLTSIAQFGVRIKLNNNNFGALNDGELFEDRDAFGSSAEIGIDYWFKMKNQRIEFLPEISYELANDKIEYAIPSTDVKFQSLNFNWNTNIYFMDLYSDCDCPTFSKQGNALSKGLHLILSPGIKMFSINEKDKSNDYALTWSAGIGVGMDIGINNLLTVTPFSIFRYNSKLKWTNSVDIPAVLPEDFNVTQITFGLRLGFRPDYKTPRFGR